MGAKQQSLSVITKSQFSQLSREQIGQIMMVIHLAGIAGLKQTDHTIRLYSIKGCSIDLHVKSG